LERSEEIGSVGASARVIQGDHNTIQENINSTRHLLTALHQLPPDISDFTGRGAELRLCSSMLNKNVATTAATVVAVYGKPGVGKSALVIHLANALESVFPDGQLYVDMGIGGASVEPPEVLASFLHSLGVPLDDVPPSVPAQQALFRSLLNTKRVLIVLDNAKSESQIRALLPAAAGCAALVTSRAPLAGLDDARLVDLDVMEPDEAAELLAKITGIERVDSDRLLVESVAGLCGHLPLALRIAGRRSITKGWTLQRMRDRLADERRRLKELQIGDRAVRAAFQVSYESLTEVEARAFRLSAVLRGQDFTCKAVAAVLDAEHEQAEAVLDALVSAQLIDVLQGEGDRYALHDLLRLFAEELLEAVDGADVRQAALERGLEWYLNSIKSPYMALQSASAEMRLAEAVSWYDAEYANLMIMIRAARDANLHRVALGLVGSVVRFQSFRLLWADARAIEELALDIARQTGNRRAEGYALEWLARISRDQGRYEEAIRHAKEAMSVAKELKYTSVQMTMLRLLGSIHEQQGHRKTALTYLQQQLELARSSNSRHDEADAQLALGVLYQRWHKWQSAEDYHKAALTIFQSLDDTRCEARCLDSLAHVHQRQKSWLAAVECHMQALAIREHLNSRHAVATTQNNLAHVYWHLRRFDEARTIHQQALQTFHALGDDLRRADAMRELAVVIASQGHLDEAIQHLEAARDIAVSLRHASTEADVWRDLGMVYGNAERWDAAIDCYERQLKIVRDMEDRFDTARALVDLGSARMKRGDDATEIQANLREALSLFRAMRSPEAEYVRAKLDTLRKMRRLSTQESRRNGVAGIG
jgi:tetratricopeptide (TPR) repeat protein